MFGFRRRQPPPPPKPVLTHLTPEALAIATQAVHNKVALLDREMDELGRLITEDGSKAKDHDRWAQNARQRVSANREKLAAMTAQREALMASFAG